MRSFFMRTTKTLTGLQDAQAELSLRWAHMSDSTLQLNVYQSSKQIEMLYSMSSIPYLAD